MNHENGNVSYSKKQQTRRSFKTAHSVIVLNYLSDYAKTVCDKLQGILSNEVTPWREKNRIH